MGRNKDPLFAIQLRDPIDDLDRRRIIVAFSSRGIRSGSDELKTLGRAASPPRPLSWRRAVMLPAPPAGHVIPSTLPPT